jgi:hypothetical protein
MNFNASVSFSDCSMARDGRVRDVGLEQRAKIIRKVNG